MSKYKYDIGNIFTTNKIEKYILHNIERVLYIIKESSARKVVNNNKVYFTESGTKLSN